MVYIRFVSEEPSQQNARSDHVPICRQNIYIDHDDVGQSVPIRNTAA